MGVLALLVFPPCLQDSGYEGVPIPGWAEVAGGHYLRDPRGVHRFAQKCALCSHGYGSYSIYAMLCMLALAGPPSLHGCHACMVLWVEVAFRRNCRQSLRKASSSPFGVFLFCRNSSFRWWGQVFCHLWIGWVRHPGASTRQLAVEVFCMGRWLTHGDMVLEAQVNFIAVEHRLIPDWVRSLWARLRSKGLAAVLAPASQESCWSCGCWGYQHEGCTCFSVYLCHCSI